ncbi:MAG: hypothetical protein H7Y18_13070, partial [Clostridiaceae bacterium]|nr:hypothetical protein [Clostridiaceae bacterium]
MKVFVDSDYDKLAQCIVVYPCNLQIGGNNTTKQQIDKKVASNQYNNLINALSDYGIKLHFFDLNDSSSQVFSRDIGFVIQDILFISHMTLPDRQCEIDGLIEFVHKYNIKHHIMQNCAEGGDILVNHNKIFIGQGNRTCEKAVTEINEVLSANNMSFELIKVYFETSKIHLDCVFDILDKDTCIISEDIFNSQDVVKHFSKIIEAPRTELDSLAINIISLDNITHLCSSESFTQALQKQGFNTIYINFSEIIKASG